MAKFNKACLCCSTRYNYCPSCSGADRLAPIWKSEFCSESCMTLWTTLTKYNMNMLSKSEAKSIISALDIKSIDTYVTCVQRDYAKVMTPDPKPKRGKRAELKLFDEALIIEPVVTEPESHAVVIKKENE